MSSELTTIKDDNNGLQQGTTSGGICAGNTFSQCRMDSYGCAVHGVDDAGIAKDERRH
jgi:hypothetical protein